MDISHFWNVNQQSDESEKDWYFTSSNETRLSLKWMLEKFSLREREIPLRSPSFNFLSFQWSLCLRQGNTYNWHIVDEVTLSLCMENPQSETKVKCKMCLKDRNGQDCHVNEFEYVFSAKKKIITHILIDREVLFKKKRSQLLYNDVLTVYCEIGAVQNVDRGVDQSTTTETKDLGVPKNIQVFIDDMDKLLKDHKSCDVTLRVGDKKFPAHKFLLAARSKVFAAMFEHDTEESRSGTVIITDIESDLVSDLLHYVYSGQVEQLSVDKAIELYSAADKYALLDLKDQCADFLKKNLSEENVCGIALMADAHNDGMLIDSIKVFIQENTSILSSEQWKRLAEHNLRLAYEFSLSLNKVLTAISAPRE